MDNPQKSSSLLYIELVNIGPSSIGQSMTSSPYKPFGHLNSSFT